MSHEQDHLAPTFYFLVWAFCSVCPSVLPELPKRRRRKGQSVKDVYAEEEEDAVGEYENREDEEEDEEDEFQPSEGSENEMETEILDYM